MRRSDWQGVAGGVQEWGTPGVRNLFGGGLQLGFRDMSRFHAKMPRKVGVVSR